MDANAIIEWIVIALILSGTVLSLLSSLGIIRLPDVYTRAHATTKSATLGILCILLGAFIYFLFKHEVISIRLLLGIVFVFLTAPVGGHLIIRAAHRSKVNLADISVQDDLQDYLEQAENEAAEAADAADEEVERKEKENKEVGKEKKESEMKMESARNSRERPAHS